MRIIAVSVPTPIMNGTKEINIIIIFSRISTRTRINISFFKRGTITFLCENLLLKYRSKGRL